MSKTTNRLIELLNSTGNDMTPQEAINTLTKTADAGTPLSYADGVAIRTLSEYVKDMNVPSIEAEHHGNETQSTPATRLRTAMQQAKKYSRIVHNLEESDMFKDIIFYIRNGASTYSHEELLDKVRADIRQMLHETEGNHETQSHLSDIINILHGDTSSIEPEEPTYSADEARELLQQITKLLTALDPDELQYDTLARYAVEIIGSRMKAIREAK